MTDSERDFEERKHRAGLFAGLAKSVWDRFNSRRDVESKTSVAIWTLFGAGAFGVLNTSTSLPWWAFAVALGITAPICITYGVWLQYLIEAFRRDAATSYYWELQLHELADKPIPKILDPKYGKSSKSSLWEYVADQQNVVTVGVPSEEELAKLQIWHTSQKCQLAIAIVFGLFFIGSVAIKSNFANSSGPKISIEGAFDAESLTKVKLRHAD